MSKSNSEKPKAGPRSMTGFGRAEGEWRGARATVEIRSLNHRYLELRVRLPRDLSFIEHPATELIRSRLTRGRLDVNLNISGVPQGTILPVLNLPLARSYVEFHKQLQEELGGQGEPDPGLILGMRDVILWEKGIKDLDAEWTALKPIFDRALDALIEAGLAEGARLAEDLRQRIERLEHLVDSIKGAQPASIQAHRDKLAGRIGELTDKPDIDPERLAQEMAYYAERCDCAEEMVRLQAHRERFIEILERGGPTGRELDFLVQEMGREVNTASSKALSVEVSHAAVETKSELDKIREQVQNLE